MTAWGIVLLTAVLLAAWFGGCIVLGTWYQRTGWHDHFERAGRRYRAAGRDRAELGARWAQRDFDRGYGADV